MQINSLKISKSSVPIIEMTDLFHLSLSYLIVIGCHRAQLNLEADTVKCYTSRTLQFWDDGVYDSY